MTNRERTVSLDPVAKKCGKRYDEGCMQGTGDDGQRVFNSILN